jgi:hypothetical protein
MKLFKSQSKENLGNDDVNNRKIQDNGSFHLDKKNEY